MRMTNAIKSNMFLAVLLSVALGTSACMLEEDPGAWDVELVEGEQLAADDADEARAWDVDGIDEQALSSEGDDGVSTEGCHSTGPFYDCLQDCSESCFGYPNCSLFCQALCDLNCE